MNLNFAAVNSAALGSSITIVQKFSPHGQLKGSEWICLNPNRTDKTLGSFRVNIRTGKWADFAIGVKGGDLISFVAYITGANQRDAALQILSSLKVGRNEHY